MAMLQPSAANFRQTRAPSPLGGLVSQALGAREEVGTVKRPSREHVFLGANMA